jgi:hypothetical protein
MGRKVDGIMKYPSTLLRTGTKYTKNENSEQWTVNREKGRIKSR